MHVKLKEGMRHVYKVGKITLTMQFSEDSDDEDHVKVLRTKEGICRTHCNPSLINAIAYVIFFKIIRSMLRLRSFGLLSNAR